MSALCSHKGKCASYMYINMNFVFSHNCVIVERPALSMCWFIGLFVSSVLGSSVSWLVCSSVSSFGPLSVDFRLFVCFCMFVRR